MDGIPLDVMVGPVVGALVGVDGPVLTGAEQWGQWVSLEGTWVPQKGHLFLVFAASICASTTANI